MDSIDIAFPYRVLLLAGVFAIMALLHRRRDPSRWKEYAFVLAAGCVGGVIGLINDLITSTLCPTYFEIAKGIEGGNGFVWRVVGLGFHAGFVAGALAACAYLYANNPRPDLPRVGYPVLYRLMIPPIVVSLGLACIAGVGSVFATPHSLVRDLGFSVPVQGARSFLAVAAIHAGLYVGLLIGVALSLRNLRRERTAASAESLAVRPTHTAGTGWNRVLQQAGLVAVALLLNQIDLIDYSAYLVVVPLAIVVSLLFFFVFCRDWLYQRWSARLVSIVLLLPAAWNFEDALFRRMWYLLAGNE